MKIPVFISVRLDSSRLPGKCLLSFGNKETVLSFVIKRSRFFKLDPIITTDKESYENGLKFLIKELNVNFFIGPKGVVFKIGRNAKNVNYVRINLNSMDTYDIEFLQVRKFKEKVKSSAKGVYADTLRGAFEQHTGLRTSL